MCVVVRSLEAVRRLTLCSSDRSVSSLLPDVAASLARLVTITRVKAPAVVRVLTRRTRLSWLVATV